MTVSAQNLPETTLDLKKSGAFWAGNSESVPNGGALISPPVGEMPDRAEGGVSHKTVNQICTPASGLPRNGGAEMGENSAKPTEGGVSCLTDRMSRQKLPPPAKNKFQSASPIHSNLAFVGNFPLSYLKSWPQHGLVKVSFVESTSSDA